MSQPATPPRTPQELVGGPRGLVDSALPPISFVAVNAWQGLGRAASVAIGVAALLLAVRVARREETRHAAAGFFGVLLAALIARQTGRAENYFLPGLVFNAVYCAGFVVSVLVQRPVVGLLLRQFSDKPPEWHDQPAVRRAYAEVTLFWAGTFALRLAVQWPLYLAGLTGWLAVAKLAMGWPLYLLALGVTLPWVSRRTAGVPVS